MNTFSENGNDFVGRLLHEGWVSVALLKQRRGGAGKQQGALQS